MNYAGYTGRDHELMFRDGEDTHRFQMACGILFIESWVGGEHIFKRITHVHGQAGQLTKLYRRLERAQTSRTVRKLRHILAYLDHTALARGEDVLVQQVNAV